MVKSDENSHNNNNDHHAKIWWHNYDGNDYLQVRLVITFAVAVMIIICQYDDIKMVTHWQLQHISLGACSDHDCGCCRCEKKNGWRVNTCLTFIAGEHDRDDGDGYRGDWYDHDHSDGDHGDHGDHGNYDYHDHGDDRDREDCHHDQE